MKLATFEIGKRETYGAVSAADVTDLGSRLGPKFPTIDGRLTANNWRWRVTALLCAERR